MLAVDNVLGLVSLVVPEDTDVIATIHDELVAATTRGVLEPPSEVLALLERSDCGGVVGLVHSSFGSVSLNIADLVDAQNVLLVEGHHVELAGGRLSLGGGGVLHESESGWGLATSPCESDATCDVYIPHRLSIFAHGHVNSLLFRLAHGVELLEQKFDQLGLLFGVDLGQAVDDYKSVISTLQLNLELLANVGEVNLIFVELVVVEVGLLEVVE